LRLRVTHVVLGIGVWWCLGVGTSGCCGCFKPAAFSVRMVHLPRLHCAPSLVPATRILDPKSKTEIKPAAAAPATPWPKTKDQGCQQWRVKWPTSCCHPTKSKVGGQTIQNGKCILDPLSFGRIDICAASQLT